MVLEWLANFLHLHPLELGLINVWLQAAQAAVPGALCNLPGSRGTCGCEEDTLLILLPGWAVRCADWNELPNILKTLAGRQEPFRAGRIWGLVMGCELWARWQVSTAASFRACHTHGSVHWEDICSMLFILWYFPGEIGLRVFLVNDFSTQTYTIYEDTLFLRHNVEPVWIWMLICGESLLFAENCIDLSAHLLVSSVCQSWFVLRITCEPQMFIYKHQARLLWLRACSPQYNKNRSKQNKTKQNRTKQNWS